MRISARLVLFLWVSVLVSGLLAELAGLSEVPAITLLSGDLGLGAVLVALAVLATMPRFRGWRREPGAAAFAVVLGAVVGAVGGLAYILGIFVPYVAGWGGKELSDFGGNDVTWQEYLGEALAWLGIVGAVAGATFGLAAWVLRLARLAWRGLG